MNYHDAEVVAALLDALGHTTEVRAEGGGLWRIVLACGCDRSAARCSR